MAEEKEMIMLDQMTYNEFARIAHEEGVRDEKGVRELWKARPRPGHHHGITDENIRTVFRTMVFVGTKMTFGMN